MDRLTDCAEESSRFLHSTVPQRSLNNVNSLNITQKLLKVGSKLHRKCNTQVELGSNIFSGIRDTVMLLRFQTDMPGQTVQTQIRMLLEEQSDQGLHCLPFRLHRLDSLLYGRAT